MDRKGGTEPGAAERGDALTRVLGEGLVDSAFQPIVDLEQGEIAGFEALTRTRSGSGFADPGSLFDAAAATGQLWSLECLTRDTAFVAAAEWPSSVHLFLNCSPLVFADGRFAAEAAAGVARTQGLAPSRVVLEITERSEPAHADELARQVDLLKGMGFQIAIDDVGAGTSGLSRIMRLRPHWLKLDRDLVQQIDRDRVKQNLLRFLVHFARLSGVKVVAEGVEREQELSALIDLGVSHAQGYYLGRPGSRDQTLDATVRAWLRDRCAAAQAKRLCEPQGNRVMRVAQPALVAFARMTVSQAAAELEQSAQAPGLAVVDRNRFMGWCERARVLEAAAGPGGSAPVSAIMAPAPVWVSADATISDALDVAATRDDRLLGQPLVIFESGQVQGIIPLRDLLAAGAEVARGASTRTAPVTGLPGRVRADEHTTRLIDAAHRPDGPAPGNHVDAAIIDIRHMSDFNGAYGYDLGDQLLQDLCSLMQITLVREDKRMFLAHLGDDRFLVTSPGGILDERVPALARRFDRVASGYCETALFGEGPEAAVTKPKGLGLRIVLLPNAFERIKQPRDLHLLAERLRRPPSGWEPRFFPLGSRCLLIREPDPPAMRLSA